MAQNQLKRKLEQEDDDLIQRNRELQQQVHELQKSLRDAQDELDTLKNCRSPRLTMEKIVNRDKLVGKISSRLGNWL